MPAELAITHGSENRRVAIEGLTTIGRSKPGVQVDIDLQHDPSVSRPHARLVPRDQGWLVEDAGSRWGTKLNGIEIKGRGPQPFRPGDTLLIGETTLRLHRATQVRQPLAPPAMAPPTAAPHGLPAGVSTHAEGAVQTVLGADGSKAPVHVASESLQMLFELPLLFAQHESADGLLQEVVERLVKVMPDVARVGLLLRAQEDDALLLAAHVNPPGETAAVSETLARRVMASGEGLIWRDAGDGGDVVQSMIRQGVRTGMYAPLTFAGQTFGALCADNPRRSVQYKPDDLRLLLAVANYAAMALANLRLQEQVRVEATAKANLARQFSPQVVDWLLKQKGRTRLGGSRISVTVLASDVRGFTRTSANMEPDDVVDMLNAYFRAMVPIVHAEGGLVDKFIGDAILAIWGFPPPDEEQHLRAVRSAVAMQAAIAYVSDERRRAGLPVCDIGIGVHSGEVLQGFIGSEDRQEFTVIGDAVNKAARFCDGAAGGEVLISPQVHARVWKQCAVEAKEVSTKHEGMLRGYRVLSVQEG